MEGTDLTPYIDINANHDHTYYGNGCPGGWNSGSTVACESKETRTWSGGTGDKYRGEKQDIGTYYHFQAATTGSGGALTEDNAIASDTFCPLGWQLPYGGKGGDYYDKSKSFRFLTNSYNFVTSSDGYKEMMYPFDYIPSGATDFGTGRLYEMNINGSSGSLNAWSNTNTNDTAASKKQIWSSSIEIYNFPKKYGVSIRCVPELAS